MASAPRSSTAATAWPCSAIRTTRSSATPTAPTMTGADYASYAPTRLFAIANISMTDPAEDLKELHRIKKLGCRGIFISNDPLAERRYDNPMWEEFWSVVEEYDLPVNIHILTRQGG